jgi:hypothetical protein
MKKNESTRTIAYVVVAAVSIGLAFILSPPGEITPKQLTEKKVGAPFFENFTNPNDATSIKVASWDEASATPKHFAVSFQNGKWTIPTHHNYPADGQDRLAKTATSVLGIKREELAGESKQVHEQLGVIDPEDKDLPDLKGRGQKLTLKKGEDTLVDLIIGKQLKDRPGFYYVRKPGDDATFVAKLDINLSTKFSEWIETDLLKLNRDDLKDILLVDSYAVDRARGEIVPGESNQLDRDKSTDPWKLKDLDESTEEVDTAKVNAMIGALDDLKIVGVRPKPKGFLPDLSLDPEIIQKQVDPNDLLNRLAVDLHRAGFILTQEPKSRKFHLYSKQGDLTAATNKGVKYLLRFGDVFLGDETEIEIGGATNKESEKNEGESADDEEAPAKPDGKDSKGKQSSRYLFVTVSFDESFLGPRPEKPERPAELALEDKKPAGKKTAKAKSAAEKPGAEKPAGKKPADEQGDEPGQENPKTDDNCIRNASGDDESDQKPESAKDSKPESKSEAPAGEAPKADDKPAADPKPEAKPESPDEPKDEPEVQPEPKKSQAELKREYDAQVRKYESDLQAYDDKVTAGKKQVDELNARFAGWYYVISADFFNKLHLTHKELVREKSKTGDAKPGIPSLENPDGTKPADEEDDPDFKDLKDN